jgi:hypothetical protein
MVAPMAHPTTGRLLRSMDAVQRTSRCDAARFRQPLLLRHGLNPRRVLALSAAVSMHLLVDPRSA